MQKGNAYSFSYGGTKDIELFMRKDSACVHFFQESSRSHEDVISADDKLCSHTLRRIVLVSLIKYGVPFSIKNISVSINGSSKTVYDVKKDGNGEYSNPVIWSMISGKLHRPFSNTWSDKAVIETILNTTKTGEDGRYNAMIALLISKSKEFESERAMYLWMAMNGFYNYLAAEAKKTPGCNCGFTKENKKQELMCEVLEIGRIPKIDENLKDQLFKKMIALVSHNSNGEDQSILNSKALSMMQNNGISAEEENLKPMFLVWLPYQIRCNYFHANIAIPLLIHRDDKLLAVLRFCNGHVENFIETELPKWINTADITDEHREMTKRALVELQLIKKIK